MSRRKDKKKKKKTHDPAKQHQLFDPDPHDKVVPSVLHVVAPRQHTVLRPVSQQNDWPVLGSLEQALGGMHLALTDGHWFCVLLVVKNQLSKPSLITALDMVCRFCQAVSVRGLEFLVLFEVLY